MQRVRSLKSPWLSGGGSASRRSLQQSCGSLQDAFKFLVVVIRAVPSQATDFSHCVSKRQGVTI